MDEELIASTFGDSSVSDQLVFLHLSDIHFNGRELVDTFDLDVTLRNELERDASVVAKRLESVAGVLVTGDIAYHGTSEQFHIAFEWLGKLCALLGCPEENVWMVPGNHDVSRTAIRESELIQVLHHNIRQAAPGGLDDALHRYLVKDKEAGPLLFRPTENYNVIAARFGCDISPAKPYWTKDLTLNDGSTLRLCGLNSTLVSDDLDDDKKLVLGSVQCERSLLREDGVEYLALCHHPPDWLLDQDTVEKSFTALARVQLFGHKHDFRLVPIGDTLRLSAGAVHPNRREPNWQP
jgi:predicted phosphodiesterase